MAATLLDKMPDIQEIIYSFQNRLINDVWKYEDLHSEMRRVYVDDYTEPDIKIVNVVVSTNVEKTDINAVKNDVDTEYYPEQFPGFVHRMYRPKATILFFKTGRLICTGVKDIADAYSSIESFTKKFDCVLSSKRKDGKEEGELIKIQNLVISVDFNYYIDLEEATYAIPRAIYEPEQFPGIIYRHVDPRAVFLIFTSGKTICVGTNDLKNAYLAAYFVRNILISKDLLIPRDNISK